MSLRLPSLFLAACCSWCGLLTLAPQEALAKSPLRPAPRVTVAPAVAAAGVPRIITVEDSFGYPCFLEKAGVVPGSVDRVVSIKLSRQSPTGGCLPEPIPYRLEASYTPEFEGEQRIIALVDDGTFVAEAVLVTRGAGSQRSRLDLTGMWFDPATAGSGVTFVHAAARNDAVFGTWFLYDVNGSPRWYTIQSVQWRGDGMEAEGVVLEGAAGINICPLTVIGCPVALTATQSIGRARIVLQNAGSARVFALGTGGNVLFTSNLVRAGI